MATTLATFDSGHLDMVHDVQLDYYGRKLATCSSDRTIKVFDVAGEQLALLADIQGHEGPVWQVAWAHPKFGNLLASCSFDHKVIVWKESPENVWTQVYTSQVHTASVNSIAWAPFELGLILACGSSDGSVSVLTHQPDSTWTEVKIDKAHAPGTMGVSWAPAVVSESTGLPAKRLVTGGCDNTVRVWQFNDQLQNWEPEAVLKGHTDWVRDVAWAPSPGFPSSTVASASQDGTVYIWTEAGPGQWNKVLLQDFKAAVWRVSWSTTGDILAVSDGTNGTTVWKQALSGQWQQVAS